MKLMVIVILSAGLFLFSCNTAEKKKEQKKKEISENIARNEKILGSDTTGNLNIAAAYEVLKYYTSYSFSFPEDSVTPEYLFRMANIYSALGQGLNAIKVLEKIENNYPDFHKKAFCIFMQADIYENQLKNIDKARYNYERFLQMYPNHPLAKDTKVLLQNIGKSPEELYQSFSEKSEKQTANK
jgi:tetratricopeptide (TPR) repeat protein